MKTFHAAGQPLISVVICTFNRSSLLRRALCGLCNQSLATDDYEVIVVDDGSNDDTRSVVEIFSGDLNLRYAYQHNAGLAAGKNHGLALARSALIAFLDDDDVCDRDYLEQHCSTHQQYPDPAYAVLGYTALAPEPMRSPLMRYVTEHGCELFSYPNLRHGAVLDYTYFWGGRSSCKRRFLLEHGVFNPVFRFGAEDIELGARLHRRGLRVVYNAYAISYMLRTLSFDDFCRRSWLQGRANWVFSQLHAADPDVQAWCRVEDIDAAWYEVKPAYEDILAAARGLDQFASKRVAAGLEVDTLATTLLHQAYANAFNVARIKGTTEAKAQESSRQPQGHAESQDQPTGKDAEPVVGNALALEVLRSATDYSDLITTDANRRVVRQRVATEQSAIRHAPPLTLPGFCYVCGRDSAFVVSEIDHKLGAPNWRESLQCTHCGLNNRMRAALHLMEALVPPSANSRFYATEQCTPLYKVLRRRYPQTVGSEFATDGPLPNGSGTEMIRLEDVTALSFDEDRFDYVLSFDVLEHVPKCHVALREFARVLAPGGSLVLTAPFDPARSNNLVRAQITVTGELIHHTEPEYHGDPLRAEGCLSFYTFGWELLDQLRAAGFHEVRAITYWSDQYKYFGRDQMLFLATTAKTNS